MLFSSFKIKFIIFSERLGVKKIPYFPLINQKTNLFSYKKPIKYLILKEKYFLNGV